jgi:hypothetical protein
VAAQEGLEFGRGHLESFDLDEFLGPVEQEHAAIGVEAAMSPVTTPPAASAP